MQMHSAKAKMLLLEEFVPEIWKNVLNLAKSLQDKQNIMIGGFLQHMQFMGIQLYYSKSIEGF